MKLNKRDCMVMLLAFLFLLGSGLLSVTSPVQSNAIHPAGPTPAAQSGSEAGGFTPLSILGILILLAPAVFLAWKSRNKKEAKITSSCCLPVIDEKSQPFKIEDDSK